MNTSLVSVVIPCYRQARYLPEALESVFAQTHPHTEAVVVNDGSDDDTASVAARYGDRIRYVYKANGGLSSARNAGLAAAQGEWVQFLDADDQLGPDKIDSQLGAAESTADILYSGYECFSDLRPGERWTYSTVELGVGDPFVALVGEWERGLSIPIHSLLFRRGLFERLGGFDPSLPNHEDWDWHLRCAAAGARFHYVPGRGALYRVSGNSMSTAGPRMRFGKFACLEKLLAGGRLTRAQREAVLRRYLADRAAEAEAAVEAGDWRGAVSLLCQSSVTGRSCRALASAWQRLIVRVASWAGGRALRRARRVGSRLLKPTGTRCSTKS
jgi:glycosyltransferase involved in cell wall biosynthesis